MARWTKMKQGDHDDAREITAVLWWNDKKTKFRGGFLTSISQSILTKLGTHIQNSLLNKLCSLRSIQMSIFLELFQKKTFLTIYIQKILCIHIQSDFYLCVVFKCQYFWSYSIKKSLLTIYIHISKGRNSVKNC